jgi:hypothetical protein
LRSFEFGHQVGAFDGGKTLYRRGARLRLDLVTAGWSTSNGEHYRQQE